MLTLSDYPSQRVVRTFDIEAISLPIVYNRYGDHDPNGLMYVLKQDSREDPAPGQRELCVIPPQPYEEVQPLVIRANVGDEIRIRFYNRLNRRASIHVQGLPYNVLDSDGANVGFNPDTTTGGCIRYTWFAQREGCYLFSDLADPRGSEQGTNIHGLFGVIIVEEAGSTWRHPVTGEPLDSGVFADVYPPTKPSFREYTIIFHDELEIRDKDGLPPVDPHTGLPNGTTAISYRPSPCATARR